MKTIHTNQSKVVATEIGFAPFFMDKAEDKLAKKFQEQEKKNSKNGEITWGENKNFEKKSRKKKSSWNLSEATDLDRKFMELSQSEKARFINQNFPNQLKASSNLLQDALLTKKRPFSSYLYQILIDYVERNKTDISENAAKVLIRDEQVLGKILSKIGTSGLDLSKDNFQLKAISFIEYKGYDVDLIENGKWLSIPKMKKLLSETKPSEVKMTSKGKISPKTAKQELIQKYKLAASVVNSLCDDDVLDLYIYYKEHSN